MLKNRFIIPFLTILFFVLIYSGQAFAILSDPIVEMLAPAGGSYVLGDAVKLQWKVNKFEANRPAFIYVQTYDASWQKLIGLQRNSAMGEISEFNWKIPADFFEMSGVGGQEGSFKFRISTRLERRWVRGRGQIFDVLSSAKEAKPTTSVTTEVEILDDEIANIDFLSYQPQQKVVVDDGKILVARYQFSALYEPWEVQRVTIVNDSEGDGFDSDASEDTPLISSVFVRYKDIDGNLRQDKGVFASNRAIISGMELFIPRNGTADMEVWAQPTDFSSINSSLSGLTFRLGMQDKGNTGATFDALGLISSSRDITLSKIDAQSTQNIKEFIVRKSAPVFELKSSTSQTLISGQNTVYEFSVSTNNSKPVSLGRLVFDVTQNGIGKIDQAEFVRSGSRLVAGDSMNKGQVYLVWDAGGSSCFAHTVQSGAGTGMDCNGSISSSSKLIVTFTDDEIISGKTDYRIRFNVQNISNNASLQIRLSDDDEESKPGIGGIVPTTGQIFNGTGSDELFSTAADFVNEATSVTNRNIIWSDRSAGSGHDHPSFTPALNPLTGTGSSSDFTNGYLIDVDGLPAVNLSD